MSTQNPEWDRKKVLQFIGLLKKHRVLWYHGSTEFKQPASKAAAWNNISKIMGMEAGFLRMKMKSIFSALRRERQKIRRSKIRGDEYVSRWFAFKPLQFLYKEQETTLEKSKMELKTIGTNTENNAELEWLNIESVNIRSFPLSVEQSSEPKQYDRIEVSSQKDSVSTDETPLAKDGRKSRKSKRLSKKKLISLSENSKDHSAIVGEYVANKHRKYGSHTQSVVEHLIFDILYKADMGEYSNPNQESSVSPSPSESNMMFIGEVNVKPQLDSTDESE